MSADEKEQQHSNSWFIYRENKLEIEENLWEAKKIASIYRVNAKEIVCKIKVTGNRTVKLHP